jgi:type 1 glutamine amidotransferase
VNRNSKIFYIIPVAVYCLSLVVNISPGLASSQELKNIEKAGPRHPLRSRRQIESMLALAPKSPAANELRELNIVLLADKKDHGPNEHDYPLWQKRWLLLLGGIQAGASSETHANLYGPPHTADRNDVLKGIPRVKVSTAWVWPSDKRFESADLIVMFCHGRTRWNEQKIKQIEAYLAAGGGFVVVHSAIITNAELSERLADVIGQTWEDGYTRFRHGEMDLKITAEDHPICLGLGRTIGFLDEAYWPFRGDTGRIKVLATSDETISKGASETKPEPMFWTYQPGKGRVFGCVLGHYTWTFDDPCFRALLLRGMAWAAGESPYRFDRLILRGAPVVL